MHQTGTALFQPYGYIGTNGSFGYGLWYNGYRNSSGGWTSLGVDGSKVGVAIELHESGFHVRHKTAPAGLARAIRLTVSDDGLPLGNVSARCSQIDVASGAISTSDAREKSLLGELDARERRAARHNLACIGNCR